MTFWLWPLYWCCEVCSWDVCSSTGVFCEGLGSYLRMSLDLECVNVGLMAWGEVGAVPMFFFYPPKQLLFLWVPVVPSLGPLGK